MRKEGIGGREWGEGRGWVEEEGQDAPIRKPDRKFLCQSPAQTRLPRPRRSMKQHDSTRKLISFPPRHQR